MKRDDLINKLPLLSGKGSWHTNDLGGRYASLHLSDGPHGLRKQDEDAKTNNDSYVSTCYPTASCLASSWDRDLVAKVADSIGQEALTADVAVVLGPGVNIKRSPLCGRNFEYYSEDPYLSGELGSAFINGVQKNGVGTSLKHFAANSQETRRMTSDSRVDERTLREIYLSAFEKCVKKANPATVMISYNYLNGYKATENRHLMTEILRDEWGYDGVTISDWGACIDLTAAVKAGLDLEMPGSGKVHLNKLKKDLEAGRITEEDILPAFSRLEKLIEDHSQNKYVDADSIDPHMIALEAALQGAVLLKNDKNMLPLNSGIEINVIGELAKTVRFQGGGSSHINTHPQPDIISEFEHAGFKVNFAPGYSVNSPFPDTRLEQEAAELVKNGCPTVFCGGLTDLAEGEGYDRKTLDLPDNQSHLVEILDDSDIIFLSFGGSPFTVPFMDKIKAMLHMYLGGEAVAKAAVMLISGEANPCGKLAETWPMSLADTPAYKNFADGSGEVRYEEGVLVGYRHYDTLGIKTLFPFGYGLSYTTFEYSDLKVEKFDGSSKEDPVRISFRIKNTGNTAGSEIAQVYVENPDDGFVRAGHELRGFEKVFLNPGEERTVEISLDDRAFSIFDTSLMSFDKAAGEYKILVGSSIDDIRLRSIVNIDGKDYGNDKTGTGLDLFIGNPECDLDSTEPGMYSVYNSLSELSERSWLGKIMLKIALKVAYSMYKGKPKDDPEVMMTIETVKDGPIDCIILQSGGIPYGIAEMIVKQANKRR
ncbi:MAG: glycoside hydrolase family 3 protein [Lachnospiraceae bacterium]|nr:glycoside hydrolase family 3 protein [Lachnospiraceae bacterium]